MGLGSKDSSSDLKTNLTRDLGCDCDVFRLHFLICVIAGRQFHGAVGGQMRGCAKTKYRLPAAVAAPRTDRSSSGAAPSPADVWTARAPRAQPSSGSGPRRTCACAARAPRRPGRQREMGPRGQLRGIAQRAQIPA